MKHFFLPAGMALWMGFASGVFAADLALKVVDKDPPKEIAEPIRALLQAKAIQILDGDKPAYEFWFAKEIPIKAKPESLAKALDVVEQTTVLGAVSIPAAQRDYRNDELAAGLYTMRFALQQQDGNHLGTAEHLTFAVLVHAKLDTKLDTFTTYKSLVRASAKDTPAEHPLTLSLRPATAEGNEPQLQSPAPEHKSIRVKVPAKAGEEKTALIFEIVYEGHAKH
jgi:hypothetical protein